MSHRIDIVAARTHPREYLLHKYWSRKPSNVVSHFISRLVPSGGVIFDPFCGSGVALLEAARLGITAYGCDINPAASLVSSLMVNSPSVDSFSAVVGPLIDEFGELCQKAYKGSHGQQSIRYTVHEIAAGCPKCDAPVALRTAKRVKRGYACPFCDEKLHFNLERLKSTDVTCIVYEDGTQDRTTSRIEEQGQASSTSYYDTTALYDRPFAPNRRILAFAGMSTRQLFTRRNFSLLTYLADRVHELPDSPVRTAALVMITASVAQCSRLIPYRNNMTTGGPAWSVPGFWVPPTHLETNPLPHIKARYAKFIQGLSSLHRRRIKAKVHVDCCDALQTVRRLADEGVSADLVFLDPPYGDSVPFLEFSQLWNSFLQVWPPVETDVSVSDRLPKEKAWTQYADRLREVMAALPSVLKPQGRLLVTFNNNDVRAWVALLQAMEEARFRCDYVTYQIPAVISSKAQFSVEGSYISDIYSVWKYSQTETPLGMSMAPILRVLQRCALARGGRLKRGLALRIFMLTMLRENLSVRCLDERDSFLGTLFREEGDDFVWKGPLANSIPDFRQEVVTVALDCLRNGARNWYDLYEVVARHIVSADIGIPDPSEVRSTLDGTVLFNKDRCHLIRDTANTDQLVLFT